MANLVVLTFVLILASSPIFADEESESCICSLEYRPVCGFNSVTSVYKTYTNPCFFACDARDQQGLTLFSEGPCPTKEDVDEKPVQMKVVKQERCFCSREYRPVCATTGTTIKTYPNICEFECAKKDNPGLQILSQGECEPEA